MTDRRVRKQIDDQLDKTLKYDYTGHFKEDRPIKDSIDYHNLINRVELAKQKLNEVNLNEELRG